MPDPILTYLTERGLSQDGLHSLTAEDVRELIVGYLDTITTINAYVKQSDVKSLVRQLEAEYCNEIIKIKMNVHSAPYEVLPMQLENASEPLYYHNTLRCYDHFNIICYVKQPDRSTCTNCRHANPTNQPEPQTT